jgi:hypothetical protein
MLRTVLMCGVALAGACEEPAPRAPTEQVAPAREGERAREPERGERDGREDDRSAEAELPETFDPRAAIVEPGAHVGEERLCHVAFAERLVDVRGRERTRYTVPVVRRVAVQCAAAAGRGWADLVLGEGRRDDGPRITAGTLARVRVVAPDGGFGNYPVLELLELAGTAEPPPEPPEPEPPPPGFDFGRAGDPGMVGSRRACAVDFAARVELVDGRDRRRHRYPANVSHRVALKCIHLGGDAWVDLVLSTADAPRALGIQRGRTVEVEIRAAEGGYAGRPVVVLGEGA